MSHRPLVRLGLVSLALGLASIGCSSRAHGTEDDPWATPAAANAAPASGEITWESYDAGIARAQAEHKPAIVVFTATWCSQCEAYRSVLADPNVIALSRRFVMIKVDIGERPELNQRYSPDGTYVPRTMFLASDGSHRPDLRSPTRTDYAYFLDTHGPDELLGLMQRALRAG